jgi:hypothetical protein
MTVNGLYDWYDVNSIVAEVTRDARSDEEEAPCIDPSFGGNPLSKGWKRN